MPCNHRLRGRLTRGGHEVGAHVHRRRFDFDALFRRQGFPQRHRLRGIAVGHYLQHSATVQIGHQRHVTLPAPKTFPIQPHAPHPFGRTPRQPPRLRPVDQALHAVPMQSQQIRRLREGSARHHHRHGERLELRGEARLRFCPRHAQALDPVGFAPAARCRSATRCARSPVLAPTRASPRSPAKAPSRPAVPRNARSLFLHPLIPSTPVTLFHPLPWSSTKGAALDSIS